MSVESVYRHIYVGVNCQLQNDANGIVNISLINNRCSAHPTNYLLVISNVLFLKLGQNFNRNAIFTHSTLWLVFLGGVVYSSIHWDIISNTIRFSPANNGVRLPSRCGLQTDLILSVMRSSWLTWWLDTDAGSMDSMLPGSMSCDLDEAVFRSIGTTYRYNF